MEVSTLVKNVFAACAGGEKLTEAWQTDKDIRATAAMAGYERSPTEGGIFLESFRQFSAAMDAFNETRGAGFRFRILIHSDVASELSRAVAETDKTGFDFSRIDGIALERNGRVYAGRYVNDPRGASGFSFTCKGVEKTFTCGRDVSDFTAFVTRLLNPPLHGRGTHIPVTV